MEWLPKNYEGAWTLGGAVRRRGVCLHSGQESEVTLLPYDDIGFHLSWVNRSEKPVRLNSNQVVHSELCTTLDLAFERLATVEHLLAALVGCGLTHVHIVVSGNEVPLLDGSAMGWVEAISEVGMIPLKDSSSLWPVLKNALVIHKGTSVITATPSDRVTLIGIIDFPYPAIGKQMFSLDLTPQSFLQDIAPARTFGFKDQIDHLREKGMIKGGGLDNSLVCDGKSWINPPLRFKDEPVRHKLLDLIGDLALVGLPKAQVLVYKGSHALHVELAKSISRECSLTKSCFD
ncbi:UDP-3-O-(3-hydroxymyristoyl) N-acetylglucosamine deacetylase [Prochlorococcus marinus str. SS51]|uniref:UDP-3-O-acyl-N-acetylglucosamine deacetylase n=1 Tax=Prochlorococcus marinus (strain SARG / CCMP1375 / SS120) TaxID=167539 RepID=Q7VAP0_PROMA|nr:UDP-3-O-acyl-N-acetylglucosamine deacetylase [Prochlorococcus marinus subsp. marinus str. CCMP1375]KGG14343.1 UDP-3-O-(3-hydroxymyristoyl) N-acetylglucosamine deacetylase [Prochlorococcus marinus str. LG]KGG33492.1 UDP-3-O-(3-hydroxymyristoyl) N-acetylglucosamine deacetylase [Prochlorococcus marinus str. SS51]